MDTKRFGAPVVATPTKMRGVAFPELPDVESNVTNETPMGSLLYPLVSVGSATYVPVQGLNVCASHANYSPHAPVLGRLDTLAQVAPKSVLFHRPFPLRAPKNRMLLL